VNAADARTVVAELGLTEHVRELALAMPPLSDDQIDKLRHIFNARYESRKGPDFSPSGLDVTNPHRCDDCRIDPSDLAVTGHRTGGAPYYSIRRSTNGP
jgi:hypothetical protein